MPDFTLILVALTILMFFVMVGLAFGSLLISQDQKKSTIKARVKRLQNVPEELMGELRPALDAEAGKKSLLSRVDLQPVLGRFTGEGYFAHLEEELARADIPLRVSEFIILRLGFVLLGALLVTVLLKNVVYGILTALVLLFLHIPVLKIRAGMRISKFTNQLGDFLTLIVNSLRAGQTFMQGCTVAVVESPNPIAVEFKQVIKEVNLGMTESESMENMLKRIPSEELKIVVSGYIIQRKVGGNLAEILETTAHTIRERIKIQGQIRVLTTQGKLSGFLVGCLPFILGIILTLLNHEYMQPLITTIPGYCLIGLALLMQATGAFIIWRIVDIKI